jgi:hypothetical protein
VGCRGTPQIPFYLPLLHSLTRFWLGYLFIRGLQRVWDGGRSVTRNILALDINSILLTITQGTVQTMSNLKLTDEESHLD